MERLKPGWETFDHMADIGIRGTGKSLEEAFGNGANALFSLMVRDINAISCKEKKCVECSSYDLAGLFVAWINTLIAISDLEGMVFGCYKIHIEDTRLEGAAIGEKWSEKKHGRGIEVKGATFTEARVERMRSLWVVQCVVDV